MFHVYILQSDTTRRYYTGTTQDIRGRLKERNAGENKSTRHAVPWNLVHREDFLTRSEALRKEKQIKSRGVARYLADHRTITTG